MASIKPALNAARRSRAITGHSGINSKAKDAPVKISIVFVLYIICFS